MSSGAPGHANVRGESLPVGPSMAATTIVPDGVDERAIEWMKPAGLTTIAGASAAPRVDSDTDCADVDTGNSVKPLVRRMPVGASIA